MKFLPTAPNALRALSASLVALTLGLAASPASADDRDLFQPAAESPYVMMLLDTSGSMNAQLAGNVALGDQANPGARFYQAKAALYDVVRGLDDRIRLGFAHFPQPGSSARRKHYLYRRGPGQANPPWWDALQWPLETDDIVFGRWVVDGDNSNYRWCNNPTNNRGRLNAFPKLDHDGTVTTTIYTNNINGNGQRLRVRFTGLAANTLGNPTFDLQINVTMGGDGHDGAGCQTFVAFDLANLARGLLAVHLGHRNVGEDDVGALPLEMLDRLKPVFGKHQVDIERFHHLFDHHAVGGVVLGNKDAHGRTWISAGGPASSNSGSMASKPASRAGFDPGPSSCWNLASSSPVSGCGVTTPRAISSELVTANSCSGDGSSEGISLAGSGVVKVSVPGPAWAASFDIWAGSLVSGGGVSETSSGGCVAIRP